MAVTTTTRLAGPFLGTGTVTTFFFAFKVFKSADLYVEVVDSSGNAAAYVLGTDYTTVLNANQDTNPGGSVTLAHVLAAGSRMIITSDIEQLQQVVLTNLGGFFPDVLNGSLDRLTILNQQQQVDIDNSIKVSSTDGVDTTLPPAAARANKILAFAGDGSITVTPKPVDGAQGPQGQAGPAGTVTASGVNGSFTVPGGLIVDSGIPRFFPANQADNTLNATVLYSPSNSYYGYGRNVGNPDGINNGGWLALTSSKITYYTNVRGIQQSNSLEQNVFATGDSGILYGYNNHAPSGGNVASDEGTTGATLQNIEHPTWFHGVIAGTSGLGDVQPTYQAVVGASRVSDVTPIDQGMMINVSKGTVAGNFTARSSNFQDWILQIPITVTAGAVGGGLPLTTAWGKFTDTLQAISGASANYGVSTVNVTLQNIAGVPQPLTLGMARMIGTTSPEMVQITNAPAPSGNVQTITFRRRYGQSAGGYLFQGGLAGQVMSFDANLDFWNALDGSGKRIVHIFAGAITPGVGLFAVYQSGSSQARAFDALPEDGTEAASPANGFNSVHFFPAAEVVANLAVAGTNPPMPLLEQNNVAWSAGDIVEACSQPYGGGRHVWAVKRGYTPSRSSFGDSGFHLSVSGPSMAGAYRSIVVQNENPASYYRPAGPLRKPRGITFEGNGICPTRYGMLFTVAPDSFAVDSGSGVIVIEGDNGDVSEYPFANIKGVPLITVATDTFFGGGERLIRFPVTVRAEKLSAGIVNITVAGTSPAIDDPNNASPLIANTSFVHAAINAKGAITQSVPLASGETLNFDAAGRFISKT